MTQPGVFLNSDPQLVDGIDVDAVVAAVRSCAGVDDLDGGQLGSAASYLPGRTVPGVRVSHDRVSLQVRIRWAVPVAEVGAQLRAAVGPVIAGRRLEILVSDIADPPALTEPGSTLPGPTLPGPPPGAGAAGGSDQEEASWTSGSADFDVTSSVSITPTTVVTPTSSSPVSPRSTNPLS